MTTIQTICHSPVVQTLGEQGPEGAAGPAGAPGIDGTAAILAADPLAALIATDILVVIRGGIIHQIPFSAFLTSISAGGQFNFANAGNSGIYAGAL